MDLREFRNGGSTPDEGVGDQRPDSEGDETLTTRFNEINRAIEEIRTLITKREEAHQREQRRITRDLPPLPGMEPEADAVKPNTEFAKVVAAMKSLESPYQLTLGKPANDR